MTERLFKRVPVNIEAEIFASRESYPAFIINISQYGVHVKVAKIEPGYYPKSEADIDLKFQLPSGETVNLYCMKKWTCKNTSNSIIENIGVEIIDPPKEYRDFYQVISHT